MWHAGRNIIKIGTVRKSRVKSFRFRDNAMSIKKDLLKYPQSDIEYLRQKMMVENRN